MQGWANLPNGEKKWLVWIRDWDIDRQAVYRYREPVQLPKGSVLHMRYVYDNSAANPRNPHNPPVRVRAGNRSEDEMAHMWLQVLPVHVAAGAPDARLELEEAWMRARLRKTPGDRVSEYNLGAALAGEGKFAEASELYSAILRRDPGDALTLTAQGVALDGAGDTEGARKAFEAVIGENKADPAQVCNARFDLASLDLRHDQPERAEAELRAQLDACPEDAETHAQLARAFAQSGDMEHALSELRAAEKLNPDDAAVHSALSQVLAGAGKIEDAAAEQRLALKLAADDADGWNNLGALEARLGQTKAAREEFERALRIDPAHVQARANLARLPASP
jgi:Flp pilus assembly protein TadD